MVEKIQEQNENGYIVDEQKKKKGLFGKVKEAFTKPQEGRQTSVDEYPRTQQQTYSEPIESTPKGYQPSFREKVFQQYNPSVQDRIENRVKGFVEKRLAPDVQIQPQWEKTVGKQFAKDADISGNVTGGLGAIVGGVQKFRGEADSYLAKRQKNKADAGILESIKKQQRAQELLNSPNQMSREEGQRLLNEANQEKQKFEWEASQVTPKLDKAQDRQEAGEKLLKSSAVPIARMKKNIEDKLLGKKDVADETTIRGALATREKDYAKRYEKQKTAKENRREKLWEMQQKAKLKSQPQQQSFMPRTPYLWRASEQSNIPAPIEQKPQLQKITRNEELMLRNQLKSVGVSEEQMYDTLIAQGIQPKLSKSYRTDTYMLLGGFYKDGTPKTVPGYKPVSMQQSFASSPYADRIKKGEKYELPKIKSFKPIFVGSGETGMGFKPKFVGSSEGFKPVGFGYDMFGNRGKGFVFKTVGLNQTGTNFGEMESSTIGYKFKTIGLKPKQQQEEEELL